MKVTCPKCGRKFAKEDDMEGHGSTLFGVQDCIERRLDKLESERHRSYGPMKIG